MHVPVRQYAPPCYHGGMRIISWNVNGLRSIYQKGFPAWLAQSGADLACVQEIKARAADLPVDLFSARTYAFAANYAERPGYSGVGTYYKGDPVVVAAKLGHPRFDREGRIVRLDYPKFIFLGLYLPNGSRDQRDMGYKMEVYAALGAYLRKFPRKHFILAGDFNIAHREIDLARPMENRNSTMFTLEERRQIDRLESLGFVDSFRSLHAEGGRYSWWPYFAQARERNVGWRIDYVFVSRALAPKLRNAFLLPAVMGSDHCPVGIDIDL